MHTEVVRGWSDRSEWTSTNRLLLLDLRAMSDWSRATDNFFMEPHELEQLNALLDRDAELKEARIVLDRPALSDPLSNSCRKSRSRSQKWTRRLAQ
jgi:hypothetical protein